MNQVYSIQHYVIKFVSYDRSFKWFSPVSSTNKTDRHDIIQILLKVALNTIMNHSLLRVIVSVPLEDKSFRLPYPLTLPCRIVEYIPILYFTFIFSLFVFVSETVHKTVYRPGSVHIVFSNARHIGTRTNRHQGISALTKTYRH